MSTGLMTGPPATVNEVPCASMVVPCGIDAMRTSVAPSAGAVVGGTLNQTPGSKWIPTGWAGSLTSLMICLYGMPLSNTSPWTMPRLGIDPSADENDRVSSVGFSSRMLSLGTLAPLGRGLPRRRRSRSLQVDPGRHRRDPVLISQEEHVPAGRSDIGVVGDVYCQRIDAATGVDRYIH